MSESLEMGNGRLKIENYNDVMYVEACMNDEMTLEDLEYIRESACKMFSCPVDVICKKVGSYSVSIDVQKAAMAGIKEFRNFVYVAEDRAKKQSAEYAVASYMRSYSTQIASSREEAYALLKEAC